MKRTIDYSKILKFFIFAFLPISCYAENYNQTECEELKRFYVTYQEIWNEYPNVIWWMDQSRSSYVRSHCTPEFYSCVERENTEGVGMDLLTCDYGDTMIMSTMEIKPSDNCYIMTFKADGDCADKGKCIKDVKLYIYTENGLISDVVEAEQ